MEVQNTEINQTPNSNPNAMSLPENRDSRKKLFLITGGIILLIILFSSIVYFLGHQNGKTSNSPTSTETNQITNTETATEETSPTPPPDINTYYTNTTMDFSFTLPENFEIISENSGEVIFGAKSIATEDLIPYLTIYKDAEIPYQSFAKCEPSPKAGCGDTSDYTLNEYASDYTKVFNHDASYDLVTINDPKNTNGPKQIKMIVAGGGLPQTFIQILDSFKFLK